MSWHNYDHKDVAFSALIGETLKEVTGLEKGMDVVTFVTESGKEFQMYHSQDCCERVEIEDVTGNVEDLIGSMILKADENSNADEPPPHEYVDSFTWTFYTLATMKGYVTIRWLGESNGYYGEGVDFVQVK